MPVVQIQNWKQSSALTALSHSTTSCQVTILAVHVMCTTARVVSQPYTKVLYSQWLLFIHLLAAQPITQRISAQLRHVDQDDVFYIYTFSLELLHNQNTSPTKQSLVFLWSEWQWMSHQWCANKLPDCSTKFLPVSSSLYAASTHNTRISTSLAADHRRIFASDRWAESSFWVLASYGQPLCTLSAVRNTDNKYRSRISGLHVWQWQHVINHHSISAIEKTVALQHENWITTELQSPSNNAFLYPTAYTWKPQVASKQVSGNHLQ